jgi:hypothetical protein
MIALGGACDMSPPTGGWNPPETCASDNFNPGKPTGLDVLEKIVYMTGDKAPYLYIASTTNAICDSHAPSQDLFVDTGTFDAGNVLNDIRVSRASNGRIYAYVVANTPTKQFRVIDVTNPHAPIMVASSTLSNVNGSYPEGFRIFIYDNKAYVLTRETAGREFHIFDISTPWNASSVTEFGGGYAINRTAESIVVTKKNISGVTRYFAYMATDLDSKEVTVLDVTNPTSITEITFSDQDLPGNHDGASVYLSNDRLYVGRLSNSGSDFYVFDASRPNIGLTKIGEQDIGTSVIGVVATGPFSFLATTKSNMEVQVWRSDPGNIVSINTDFNFPNLVENGIRYSENYVYVASQGNDALRILYSP